MGELGIAIGTLLKKLLFRRYLTEKHAPQWQKGSKEVGHSSRSTVHFNNFLKLK